MKHSIPSARNQAIANSRTLLAELVDYELAWYHRRIADLRFRTMLSRRLAVEALSDAQDVHDWWQYVLETLEDLGLGKLGLYLHSDAMARIAIKRDVVAGARAAAGHDVPTIPLACDMPLVTGEIRLPKREGR